MERRLEVPHDQMMPGDLLEYRCPKYGIVWQWRILGIYLGAIRQESLVEVSPIMHRPGSDDRNRAYDPIMVPEPMTRGLTVVRSRPAK